MMKTTMMVHPISHVLCVMADMPLTIADNNAGNKPAMPYRYTNTKTVQTQQQIYLRTQQPFSVPHLLQLTPTAFKTTRPSMRIIQ